MADILKRSQKWFTEDFGDGKEEFLIEFVNDADLAKLEREATTTDAQNNEKTDIQELDFLLINRALKDWKGFVKGGKPCKCTKENKRHLLENWPDRAKYVGMTARSPHSWYTSDIEKLKKKLEEFVSSAGNGKMTPQEQIAENV